MPEGVGKLRVAARKKFPRTFRFYDRYHTTITALAIIIFVAAVAYIGVQARETATTVTQVRGDVNVIKQQSACSPKPNGRPNNPKACEENFNTIIHKILTPLQACEFLERGAPLIQIGGRPIPPVHCVKELERAPSQPNSSSQSTPNQDATSPASNPASSGSPGTSSPGGSGGGQGNGKQPSGGQGGGKGGSPSNPGGEGAPGGSPGGPEGGGGNEGGSGGGGESGGSSSGVGKVVEGAGEVVNEVLCTVNALTGVEVCIKKG